MFGVFAQNNTSLNEMYIINVLIILAKLHTVYTSFNLELKKKLFSTVIN